MCIQHLLLPVFHPASFLNFGFWSKLFVVQRLGFPHLQNGCDTTGHCVDFSPAVEGDSVCCFSFPNPKAV